MKLQHVERSKDGWTTRKMNGGLEPIHIVARDGTTIIATVHKDEGYEDDAAKMAAAPELYEALRELTPPAKCDEGYGPCGQASCRDCEEFGTARGALAKVGIQR